MYRFFIRRPIVAMVIAIITVIVGLVAMAGLPEVPSIPILSRPRSSCRPLTWAPTP